MVVFRFSQYSFELLQADQQTGCQAVLCLAVVFAGRELLRSVLAQPKLKSGRWGFLAEFWLGRGIMERGIVAWEKPDFLRSGSKRSPSRAQESPGQATQFWPGKSRSDLGAARQSEVVVESMPGAVRKNQV